MGRSITEAFTARALQEERKSNGGNVELCTRMIKGKNNTVPPN